MIIANFCHFLLKNNFFKSVNVFLTDHVECRFDSEIHKIVTNELFTCEKKIQKIKNERAREDCESEREHLFCSLGFFGRLQKSSYSTVIKIVCTSITHGRFF